MSENSNNSVWGRLSLGRLPVKIYDCAGRGGRMKIHVTPEEERKINSFHKWLDDTADELNFTETQKLYRTNLYEEVISFRPYDRTERHKSVNKMVVNWAADNAKDPLVKILLEYMTSVEEEALLWRETFSDLEQGRLPSIGDDAE